MIYNQSHILIVFKWRWVTIENCRLKAQADILFICLLSSLLLLFTSGLPEIGLVLEPNCQKVGNQISIFWNQYCSWILLKIIIFDYFNITQEILWFSDIKTTIFCPFCMPCGIRNGGGFRNGSGFSGMSQISVKRGW